jgi:hypothetical protein
MIHGRSDPFCESIVAIPGPAGCWDLFSKDAEDGLRIPENRKIRGWKGANAWLSLSGSTTSTFVSFQGGVESRYEVGM